MFRVFVVGKQAYITEESDAAFRKVHNLRSQDVELIASYSTREALSSRQFERALSQYKVENVVDETKPPPKKIKNIYRDFPPEKIEEFRAIISKKATGRKMDEETKAKISAAMKGKPSNNKGKKRSIVANIQQSEGMKGKRTAADYTTYHEPYSGKIIRMPPGEEAPPGFIKGQPQHQIDHRVGHIKRWWSRKKKRVDESDH